MKCLLSPTRDGSWQLNMLHHPDAQQRYIIPQLVGSHHSSLNPTIGCCMFLFHLSNSTYFPPSRPLPVQSWPQQGPNYRDPPTTDLATPGIVDPNMLIPSEPPSFATIGEKYKAMITVSSLLVSLACIRLANFTYSQLVVCHVAASDDRPSISPEEVFITPVTAAIKHNPLLALSTIARLSFISTQRPFCTKVRPLNLRPPRNSPNQDHGSSPLYLTPSSRYDSRLTSGVIARGLARQTDGALLFVRLKRPHPEFVITSLRLIRTTRTLCRKATSPICCYTSMGHPVAA